MSVLIKSIKEIVTCDDQDRVLKNLNLDIEDGLIKYIGSKIIESDQVIDGQDMFAYPGLINAHHHLYQTFTRNLSKVQNLELFDWLTNL